MPRMANESNEVRDWSQKTGNGSSTFDICNECFFMADRKPTLGVGLELYNKGEPEGVLVGEVDHPLYSEGKYVCEICGVRLSDIDG